MTDAARRLRILARLAPGVVHDAKNSLNVMSLHMQALSDRLARQLGTEEAAELQRHLDAMRDHLHRADSLVARFGAHVGELYSGDGDVDLSAVVSDAAALCAHEARKRRVALEIAAPAKSMARGNRSVLEALVVEMLLEAIDAFPAGEPGALALRGSGGAVPAIELEGPGLGLPRGRCRREDLAAGLVGFDAEAGHWRLRLRPRGAARNG